MDGAWELGQRKAPLLHRFIIELQDGEPFDPEVLIGVGDDLEAIVTLHAASDPPAAGERLNAMMIEHGQLYAEAMHLFADYAANDDQEAGEAEAVRTGKARLLGERSFTEAEAFKVACGLADSTAFQKPICSGDQANRWLKGV